MSEQEVAVIFQNAVDYQVFQRSFSDFLMSLTNPARGVEVSGKTASFVVSDVYGCNPPSSELLPETVLNFRKQKHIADYSDSALQTLGEFVQWRLEKKTKEHSEKLLKYAGINDDTKEEVAGLAIDMLQHKFREKTIASCALAACFLFPSSLNHKFRSLLQVASIQVQKNTVRSWIRKTYPEVLISLKDKPYDLFKKVAVAILLRHASRALNTRLAFWAPPVLV
ncbi:hypothetical protein [Brazilian marseillevirus]|uniref:hypothetical protein n=1 Tax=Brazilian marseillevirus TaxID=1813599 RepID=UPI000783D043|nr:hypothetical protein A3303_gp120 [Brazilian marseillevirus]AMQ10628.1 hypothetical protein [Brazilian marseillevirus]